MKLVTHTYNLPYCSLYILIHTSVKLVTRGRGTGGADEGYFNPHEREARDDSMTALIRAFRILIHTSVKLVTGHRGGAKMKIIILFHTSVKLVTWLFRIHWSTNIILIHTSVKLVTAAILAS